MTECKRFVGQSRGNSEQKRARNTSLIWTGIYIISSHTNICWICSHGKEVMVKTKNLFLEEKYRE